MGTAVRLHSSYKLDITMKVLIGVSPNGTVIFVSPLFGGSSSDNFITKESGFIDLLKSGESVMADKGFKISQILPPGVNLIQPPFLMTNEDGQRQFTRNQAEECLRISRARAHVERIMQRLKLFKILTLIPHQYYEIAEEIIQLCAALVNWQDPIFDPRNLITR
jgi:hypothetical protein